MLQRTYVALPNGNRIRYSLFKRVDAESECFYIRYIARDGKRVKQSTGQCRMPGAIDAAHRLILEEYQVIAPTSETVTWSLAKERVKEAMQADGKRPKTITGYLETLDKLMAMFPLAKGPADVTDRMAGDFKTKYAVGTFSRKTRLREGEEAPAYDRCEPTVHRYCLTDSTSFRFGRLGPTAYRVDPWRR